MSRVVPNRSGGIICGDSSPPAHMALPSYAAEKNGTEDRGGVDATASVITTVYENDDDTQDAAPSADELVSANGVSQRVVQGSDIRIFSNEQRAVFVAGGEKLERCEKNSAAPARWSIDSVGQTRQQQFETLDAMMKLGNVGYEDLYLPKSLDMAKAGGYTRNYAVFPLPVTLPVSSDVKVVRVEFHLTSESMTQVDLVAALLGANLTPELTDDSKLHLSLDPLAIRRNLSSHMGGEDFNDKKSHATILGIEVIDVVNSTETTFRVKLQVADLATGQYVSLAHPVGVCDTTDDKDPQAGQYHVTLPAKHTGVLHPDLSTAYKIDLRWNGPEARRWANVDLAAAVEEYKQFIFKARGREASRPVLRVPRTNAYFPTTLVEYVLISHEAELRSFSITVNARAPRRARIATLNPQEKPNQDDYLWEIDLEAYDKTLHYLVGLYSPFAVNLSAPVRLELSPRDGAQGWKDMTTNGQRHIDNKQHKPVRLSVIMQITFLPHNSAAKLSPEHLAARTELIDAHNQTVSEMALHVHNAQEGALAAALIATDAAVDRVDTHLSKIQLAQSEAIQKERDAAVAAAAAAKLEEEAQQSRLTRGKVAVVGSRAITGLQRQRITAESLKKEAEARARSEAEIRALVAKEEAEAKLRGDVLAAEEAKLSAAASADVLRSIQVATNATILAERAESKRQAEAASELAGAQKKQAAEFEALMEERIAAAVADALQKAQAASPQAWSSQLQLATSPK